MYDTLVTLRDVRAGGRCRDRLPFPYWCNMNAREPFVRKLIELEWGRPRLAATRADPIADLELRILEAQVWCAPRVDVADIATCLRPPSLAPPTLPSNRFHLVEAVVIRRRQELGTVTLTTQPRHDGQLLLYFPDIDLGTTAAQSHSGGFFDIYTAPPWGTWVGYFEDLSQVTPQTSYLLAWVPQQVHTQATAAIKATVEDSITWLEDGSVALRSILADHWQPCASTLSQKLV
jgi:hypothetical protein